MSLRKNFHKEKNDSEMLEILERMENGAYKVYYSVDNSTGKIYYNLTLAQKKLKDLINSGADELTFNTLLSTRVDDMTAFLRKYDYNMACVSENARCGILSLCILKRLIDINLLDKGDIHIDNSNRIENSIIAFTERECSFFDLVEFTKNAFSVYGITDPFYDELLNYIMTYMFKFKIDD